MIHCLGNNTLRQHDVIHEWNKALDWQLFGVVPLCYQGISIIDVVLRGLRDTCVSKRAEYDMFESITKNHALKLNKDICIFTVMELRADVPWLLHPQMTTSVESR
jgi:hypothetical protein